MNTSLKRFLMGMYLFVLTGMLFGGLIACDAVAAYAILVWEGMSEQGHLFVAFSFWPATYLVYRGAVLAEKFEKELKKAPHSVSLPSGRLITIWW